MTTSPDRSEFQPTILRSLPRPCAASRQATPFSSFDGSCTIAASNSGQSSGKKSASDSEGLMRVALAIVAKECKPQIRWAFSGTDSGRIDHWGESVAGVAARFQLGVRTDSLLLPRPLRKKGRSVRLSPMNDVWQWRRVMNRAVLVFGVSVCFVPDSERQDGRFHTDSRTGAGDCC
jgi:hypothetical protein